MSWLKSASIAPSASTLCARPPSVDHAARKTQLAGAVQAPDGQFGREAVDDRTGAVGGVVVDDDDLAVEGVLLEDRIQRS